jgi:RNase P/RNase MRP subunit POP5
MRWRVWYSSLSSTTCLAVRLTMLTTTGARRLTVMSLGVRGTVRIAKTRASSKRSRPSSAASASEIYGA